MRTGFSTLSPSSGRKVTTKKSTANTFPNELRAKAKESIELNTRAKKEEEEFSSKRLSPSDNGRNMSNLD
jgi:hypothetical protein